MFTIKNKLLYGTLFSLSLVPLMTTVSCSKKIEQKENKSPKPDKDIGDENNPPDKKVPTAEEINFQDEGKSKLGSKLNDKDLLTKVEEVPLDDFDADKDPQDIMGAEKIFVDPKTMLTFTKSGEIVGRASNFSEETINIPEYITCNSEKIKIKSIRDFAFVKNQVDHCYPEIKTVIISSGVYEIGKRAFAGNQIKTLVLGDTIDIIGEGAFANNEISCLTLPESLKEIRNCAFAFNKLSSLEIPDWVIEIGQEAFFCNQITHLRLGDSLKNIREGAFQNNKIMTLEIPSLVKYIGDYAFSNNAITNLKLPCCLDQINNHSFSKNKLKNIIIPDSISYIGNYAFADNETECLLLGKSLEYIHDKAFLDHRLRYLELPKIIKDTLIVSENAFETNNISSLDVDTIFDKNFVQRI